MRAGKPMLGVPQLQVSTGAFPSASETDSPGQGSATGAGTALVQEMPMFAFRGCVSDPSHPPCLHAEHTLGLPHLALPGNLSCRMVPARSLPALPEPTLVLWWQSTGLLPTSCSALLVPTWVLFASCGRARASSGCCVPMLVPCGRAPGAAVSKPPIGGQGGHAGLGTASRPREHWLLIPSMFIFPKVAECLTPVCRAEFLAAGRLELISSLGFFALPCCSYQ